MAEARLQAQATFLPFGRGLMFTSTLSPAEVSMLTSVSSVKDPILPRIKCEIRGCETPMTLAALAWLSFDPGYSC